TLRYRGLAWGAGASWRLAVVPPGLDAFGITVGVGVIGYLELHAGLAGDMFLAACVDLGLDQQSLVAHLSQLPVEPWQLDCQPHWSAGWAGRTLRVVHGDCVRQRHWRDIDAFLAGMPWPARPRTLARSLFRALAEAEGAVHGVPPEEIHFHEVGAVDALVDLCGAAWAVELLDLTSLRATPPQVGSGQVACAHGLMPVPAPATAELLRRWAIPLRADPLPGELLTPTGAALLSQLVDGYGPLCLGRIDGIGVGFGQRTLADRPNAVRLLVERSPAAPGLLHDEVCVLTTHVDDMNPEWYGDLWQAAFAAGAVDMALIPITMKKGRPATRIELIGPPRREAELASLLLTRTTSLGVRTSRVGRWLLPREQRRASTPWGSVGVIWADGVPRLEHDDLLALARSQGWSLHRAHYAVMSCLGGLPPGDENPLVAAETDSVP
ncbi:MAG: LarC family nickel insertion protein, partial [Magnetococcus sp. WYHC-3]